ncbi:uncharacterized protein LOC134799680 [Cydia splendana]|uniref:uncharacterized protein LOC134799680 n=1 Tax=Cydia splendana TaxID=1100963 RepID=UPI00300C9518
MPANLSELERSKIVVLWEQGYKKAQIARELHLTRNTVAKWVNHYESDGNVTARRRPAPRSIINPAGVREIMAAFYLNPFTPTRHFANQFNCHISTVRRALHDAGIHCRIPAVKIHLTDAHKAPRLRLAEEMENFDFSCVIFADEKTFKSIQHGRKHLWCMNNTRYNPENVLPNQESGRVTVNMWAWMSANVPGELVFLPERATGENYLSVLRDVLLPSANVHSGPVLQKATVPSVSHNVQEAVAAVAHPIEHRGATLAERGVETVHARIRKHPGRAAVSRQPQQHPECIIVLDPQSI